MEMVEICATETVARAADRVWRKVGEFGDCSWVEPTARVAVEGGGVGAIRTVSLEDGSSVREQLTAQDGDARIMTYQIVETVLPITGYEATLRVVPLDAHRCEVRWSASFHPRNPDLAQALAKGFTQLFQRALQRLEECVGT
jgi:hypothetical protein